jgi:hypothetical protein
MRIGVRMAGLDNRRLAAAAARLAGRRLVRRPSTSAARQEVRPGAGAADESDGQTEPAARMNAIRGGD